MAEAQKFAHDFANMPLNELHLNVAFPGTVTSFSWNGFSAINGNNWNNWETIMHEYGHYVENVMGTYGATLWEIILNNPNHLIGTDHLNDKKDKEYAMELAWSEAWATAFAMIAYDNISYFSNISFANGIQYYIDRYNSYQPVIKESGEGQEEALIAYLWDLYDYDEETGDDISLRTTAFFNATLKDGMYTLTDFIRDFEINYSNYLDDNGQLLENSQIAPDLLPFENKVESNMPPTINFYPNGSSYNPNNEFDLQFFSSDGRLLGTFPGISATVNGNKSLATYNFRQESWDLIYSYIKPYPYVYVSLLGYHNKDPKSGPYRSAFEILKVKDVVNISPDIYGFPSNYCISEEEKEVTIGDITFNTKRLRTGYIENEYVNLCPRKKGYGTAYLEFEFDGLVSQIDVDLSFWSDDERYYAADNPEARIEYWDEETNDWAESLDLLTASLPTDRYNQTTYSVEFIKPSTRFRFYTHFNNMTGFTDRNKGRISMGDMKVYIN